MTAGVRLIKANSVFEFFPLSFGEQGGREKGIKVDFDKIPFKKECL